VYRLTQATGREHESMTACHYQTNGKMHTEFLPLPQTAANAQALINYIEKYQYDKAGNFERIEHSNSLRTTIRNQIYSAQSNRIDKSNAGCTGENRSIPHDTNGNITKLPHLPDLVWDYSNQLVEIQLNQGTNPNKAYYQYDNSGQRIRKTIVKNNGNSISERIYLGGYEIYTETTTGTVQKQRDSIDVMDDKERIALIDLEKDKNNSNQVINKTTRYQLNNHFGSSTLELDQSAQTISYEEYYPYGGTAYTAGHNQTETSLKRYRYSGKERDDESGLYYYGVRYYAPWMGRWISADPIGEKGGSNLYEFVTNDPLNTIDKEGHAPIHGAKSAVSTTGVQVPGYTKKTFGPLVDDWSGRWTTRTFFEANPGSTGYHGDIITQFDIEHKIFKGTGDTKTLIRSKGTYSGRGIPERVRFEHFRDFASEYGKPKGFDLQVVEKRTVQGMLDGDDFMKTRIGKHVTKVARSQGLRVKGVQYAFMGEQAVFVRGEFVKSLRVSGGTALGAAALLEVPIKFTWLAVTDDPERFGQFNGEPIFKIYAEQREWERLERTKLQLARESGYATYDEMQADMATNLGCIDCKSIDVRGGQEQLKINTDNTNRFMRQHLLNNPGPKHPTISNPPNR